MPDRNGFDSLVSNLSNEERKSLLARIETSAALSDEPLFSVEPDSESSPDYSGRFKAMPIYLKIFVSLRSFFTGTSREDIIRSMIVKNIARTVEASMPGIIDHRRKVLTIVFKRELIQLRDASKYFLSLLDRTIEGDKSTFIAFLASIELENIHERLCRETDPFRLVNSEDRLSETTISDTVRSAFDSAFFSITEEQRKKMSFNVRCLQTLRKLSGFTFERFLSTFMEQVSGDEDCRFDTAIDFIIPLAEVLHTLSVPPSLKLVESLLVFFLREELVDAEFDFEGELKKRMQEVDAALRIIRDFNAHVSPWRIARIVLNDPSWKPKTGSFSDDWFSVYKEFWKTKVDEQIRRYSAEMAVIELEKDMEQYLGNTEKFVFRGIGAESENIPPLARSRIMDFLARFYRDIFVAEINKPLKLILVDGEFYKRDNRVEFTDAYNDLLMMGEHVDEFDKRMDVTGDLSTAYSAIRKEMISVSLRRRKLLTAAQAAETEAERIEANAIQAMDRMLVIIKGILHIEQGGKYDSLSNLQEINGRMNKEFLQMLEHAKGRIERGRGIMVALDRILIVPTIE